MTAATGFKRLGYVVAAIIVAGVGSLALMSLLISADTVREAVKTEIRNVTGLELTLRGDTKVSLFPSGTITFNDVVLGEDGTPDPALTTDRLTARLSLFPLFIGRIEVADVALERPRINVVFSADGRSNWSGLISSLGRGLGPKSSRAESDSSFSEIRMTNGTITIRDGARGMTETLSRVDLALAWPSISKSFAATGRVVWRGETLDTAVSLNDFPSALAGERTGLKVRVNGALLKVAFEGQMSALPTMKIEGTVAADAGSLRDTLRWLGQKPLPGGGFGRFALKAKTSIASGMVALSSVNVELDGNAAEGVLTFATDGRQTLQGTLAAEDLDLTPYISAVRLVTANERNWDELPIALDGLNGLDLDLRLSAAKIVIARAKLGRTAVAANLRGGKLTVTIGESNAFGGIIKGSFALGATESGADLRSQMQFTDVDLESCLGELFNLRRVEGRGNLSIAIEAAGSSVLGLTHNLNGSINLAGRDGAVSRLNAEQVLQRLKKQPLYGAREYRNGRTNFEKLVVNLKISQGVASVEDGRLENQRLRITMTGAAAIPTRDLDLRGVASLFENTRNDPTPSLELPFIVKGSWDEPLPLFDTRALIERSPSGGRLLPKQPEPAANSPSPENTAPAAQPPATPDAAPAAPQQ